MSFRTHKSFPAIVKVCKPGCVQAMTRTLSTLQMPLNTNCLAFCPGLEDGWLAVGCYQLSACRTARHGGLHILAVAGSSEQGLKIKELCKRNLPGKRVKLGITREC